MVNENWYPFFFYFHIMISCRFRQANKNIHVNLLNSLFLGFWVILTDFHKMIESSIHVDLCLVSSAAVIRVITQRFSPVKRCVTTLITAAEETNLCLDWQFFGNKSLQSWACFRRQACLRRYEIGNWFTGGITVHMLAYFVLCPTIHGIVMALTNIWFTFC